MKGCKGFKIRRLRDCGRKLSRDAHLCNKEIRSALRNVGSERAFRELPAQWRFAGMAILEPLALVRVHGLIDILFAFRRTETSMRKLLVLLIAFYFASFSSFAQTATSTGLITGVVKDPNQAVLANTQVVLTNSLTKAKLTAPTNEQGVYAFTALQPCGYFVSVDAKGFKSLTSGELKLAEGQNLHLDLSLALAGNAETVNVSAGTVENAYRVDTVKPGSPLGTLPILNIPYSVNVISRQLIDDTQSRNFKEASKYLPLVMFQEMQGPEVLRPESRGMQGTNMQNDRKDGMGIAVTTPSAMEEYEQIEVVNGLGGPMYGPTQPSGVFNFATKRPTDEQYRQIELGYEGSTVATIHTDLGGRLGPNHVFGYRTNLVLGDGSGYGQSCSGVELNNQISEVRVKQDFSPNWHLVVGGLNQIATRNINTAVNSLINTNAAGTSQGYFANPGNYQTYFANTFQNSLAPRFQVKSDLGYLTGKFKTWNIGHDVVIGSTGYRFASFQPVVPAITAGTSLAKTALCPQGLKTCSPSVSNPLVDVLPSTGIPTYSNFVSSVIHQQGFNLADTITLTRHWLLRVGASQDWTWTNNYSATTTAPAPNYMSQGVSTTGSIIYKPRENMTVYGTFADSLQAPDTPQVSTSTTIYVNRRKALAPYRDIEGEVGYKLVLRKINFSTALFRMERPFANTVVAPTGACGTLKAGQVCDIYEITGNQVNYGAEAMVSGRIFERLMVTGGITALNPKLTDTPSPLTNNRDFVGIPAYRSNILAEYRLPLLIGAFFNFDWQHVGRRPIDDINSTYVPQYNTFDLGFRYTTKVFGKLTTWRVTANNVSDVHYWSTIGPGGITGLGTSADLGHLGEPRLVTASMRFTF